ncbi:hypothetical protein KIH23_10285 [Flavobacterium sp. CYK-55]|uniref:hypothetical protein n=1 Tax=Flavobacterium sp. CYK-55 TaxID=2835529 RepID=UPI001BCC2F16|nr:hypothetical protein [Flavobacterium sp. CYK-55]MBS7787686.1 hypothetical protein [Flavobacterium sp. CYK-55]
MKNYFHEQGIDEDLVYRFFNIAKNAVVAGVNGSKREFESDVEQYSYRCGKPVWRNSHIKKKWKEMYIDEIGRNINHLKSHGVDYYMLDGKALFCFKEMNSKSMVRGVESKRFKDAMSGNLSKYSTSMLETLAKMGILKPLPIFYIGYILDFKGSLSDVRVAHYKDGGIDFIMSLMNLDEQNLFSILNQDDDLPVKPKIEFINKKKGRSKKDGSTQK